MPSIVDLSSTGFLIIGWDRKLQSRLDYQTIYDSKVAVNVDNGSGNLDAFEEEDSGFGRRRLSNDGQYYE